jgi:DNA-binding PadR family transcriptional regulator
MAGRVTYLGEFEQVLLLAIVHLGDEAHGGAVRREIEERSGRSVSIGAAYATLDRLVDKGYVRARDAEPGERGGRARRYFTMTAAGLAALHSARELQVRMWAGIRLPRPSGKS